MTKVHFVILTFKSGTREIRKITTEQNIAHLEVLKHFSHLSNLTSVFFVSNSLHKFLDS